MKHEWRKHEKNLYMPKTKPELITVPEQKFIMLNGTGNPNNEEFAERVEVLYSLAYAIKMMPKKGYTPEGYFEYTVYPLEGVWDLTEKGRKLAALDKDELVYTIMIRQPDFVTNEVVDKAMDSINKKKSHPLLRDVTFSSINEGLCVQMLHVGPYDSEPESFKIMEEFLEKNNLERASLQHREIYLSDARKVPADKLKTILRFKVKSKA